MGIVELALEAADVDLRLGAAKLDAEINAASLYEPHGVEKRDIGSIRSCLKREG